MSNASESFVRSMRELCADRARLGEMDLLIPVDELVAAVLATINELPEDWPLQTSRSPS